jgi:hypothetical protein
MNSPESLQTNHAGTGFKIAVSTIAIWLAAVSIFLLTCSNPFEKRPTKPVLSVVADTTIAVKDTLILVAQNVPRGGKATGYAWQLDSHAISQPAAFDSACRLLFGIPDTGLHCVVVRASGEGNTVSEPETVKVTVVLDPPVVRFITRDTTVYANDTVRLVAQGTDPTGFVPAYIWTVGDSGTAISTRTGMLAYVFAPITGTYPVRVCAMDNDSILSLQDSIRVTVMANFPRIAMQPDSMTAAINDTVVMHAVRLDTSTVSVRWLWARDGISFLDTTALPSFTVTFRRLDAGKRVVLVKAVDVHKLQSNVDSARVTVHLYAPLVKAMNDTAIFTHDTMTLRAAGTDTNGTIARYLWSIDNSGYSDTTSSGSLKVAWSLQDTGSHTVRVIAVDDDTIQSKPDSLHVLVKPGRPHIVPQHDTVVFWGDTCSVTIAGIDSNGSIVKYLLNSTGIGSWTDSSSSGAFRLTDATTAVRKIISGVRDNDGLLAADTFFVRFTARPCSITVRGLRSGDTIVAPSTDSAVVSVPLSVSATRADGIADTFSFSLWTGNSPGSLVEQYHGPDSVCTLFVAGTGSHYWKLLAVDSHADTATTGVGTFSVLLRRTICFSGHSVVTGAQSAPGTGGFRRMVLDTLRAANGAKAISCAGPITTGNLLPGCDDSCCAVSGKTCANIFDSLYMHPSTSADLWIYLCGVNEDYVFPTFSWTVGWANFTALSLDTMHARNPHAEIYVLNSLPYPADTGGPYLAWIQTAFKANMPLFDRMIDSVVTDRRGKWTSRGETGVWLVDAYSALAALPDSVQNPAYFADFLHPNQAGYDRLAAQILKTMRAAGSSFLK